MPDRALPVEVHPGSLFQRLYADPAGGLLQGSVSFVGDDGVPCASPLINGKVSVVLAPGRYVVTERLRTPDGVRLPRSTSIFVSAG